MSGVTNAGAGPPVGGVKDDAEPIVVAVEPALVADDVGLDALASATRTDVVPDTGTEDGPAGVSESDGGSDPAGHPGSAAAPAAQVGTDLTDPVPEGGATAPAPGRESGASPEPARAAGPGRGPKPDRATAEGQGATASATAPKPRKDPTGQPTAPGRPPRQRTRQAQTGQARTGQAQAGQARSGQAQAGQARTRDMGSAARAGQAGSTQDGTRAGAARPANAGTGDRKGAPPRPGQPGGAPAREGSAPRRPETAPTRLAPAETAPTRPETAPTRPALAETAPTRPETAPTRPAPAETVLARPAGAESAISPAQVSWAQDAAAYQGETETKPKRRISRRALIQAGLIGGAGAAALRVLTLIGRVSRSNEPQPTNLSLSLNSNWLFGGQYMAGAESSFYDDSGFALVTVPHTVTPLSWRYWNASEWQQMWIYRRHFNGGPLLSTRRPGNRIMVDFEGVMVNATVVINDHAVSTHQGGYLPFSAELTGHVTSGDNLLAVLVDANCLPVPPMSFGDGPVSIDFFQPGGIYRDIRLRVLPQAFLSDLFALPVDVLTSQRRVDVECTVDSALPTHAHGSLVVELFDGGRLVATQATSVSLDTPGITTWKLSLTGLGNIILWSPANPKLYTVQATLACGFRDASFQPDGFYLNGERLQLFGLNRHQLYPYAGMAMPGRVQRTDARILKQELNCNMVRCSHYPQSPHFLDACDELGLLVWEEAPGWHNVTAAPGWQDLVVQNVRDMVTRDRSRPSVVIWGTRLNETPDLPGLWAATRQAAAELDGSRPSSGAMAYHRDIGWNEDVFAYNDYHHDIELGEALLRPPIPDLPYLITEAVGVDEWKPHRFAWTDSPSQLARQASLHGQAQSLARSNPSYSGMLAWAAFDYASPESRDPESVKWAGVVDLFRVPKPGAAIYQSQVDPSIRPVIVPVFFWELAGVFPIQEPTSMIASNCERLEIFVNGAHVTTGLPATGPSLYGHLPYPPFLVTLPPRVRGTKPELMIEGYVAGQQVTDLRMSSDPAGDTLALTVDDATIVADGSDATRAVFRAVDKYGNLRRYPAGEVTLTLTGPATLVGDNPFAFGAYGGLGAVWIRSLPGQTGTIILAASQPELGQAQVQVRSVPATRGSQLA
jgi:beta-galactosidase